MNTAIGKPVTNPNKEFAQKICDQINKDYPNCAYVKNNICYITAKHWLFVKNYVLRLHKAG